MVDKGDAVWFCIALVISATIAVLLPRRRAQETCASHAVRPRTTTYLSSGSQGTRRLRRVQACHLYWPTVSFDRRSVPSGPDFAGPSARPSCLAVAAVQHDWDPYLADSPAMG